MRSNIWIFPSFFYFFPASSRRITSCGCFAEFRTVKYGLEFLVRHSLSLIEQMYWLKLWIEIKIIFQDVYSIIVIISLWKCVVTSQLTPKGKGPTIILHFFFFFLGAHLSIRCCFDNETWFECWKRKFICCLFFFALSVTLSHSILPSIFIPFTLSFASLACASFGSRDFQLEDKRNIIFNFRARFLPSTIDVLKHRAVDFVWTWIYIKENRSEIPWLRFFCLVLRLILFEFFSFACDALWHKRHKGNENVILCL